MRYQAPRGTHDVLPGEAHRWQRLESIFQRTAALYGYREIRTPAFEDTELFVRTSGETSDIVTKQMYTFEDKGGRSLTLKPEGTAPVARAYIEHGLATPGAPTRLWYAMPIFRYERPQKGRYRQSHQVGLELIGSAAPAADAEIIEMTAAFYRALGIEPTVLLNCIGGEDVRRRYGQALLDHMRPYLQTQDPEAAARAERNPLRMLDTKDEQTQAAMAEAPQIDAYLDDAARQRHETVCEHLSQAGVAFQACPQLVRGLDYYNDTVFEVHGASLGSQSALCGGGRYDSLIGSLGGPPTPSVGVAMGIERALMAVEATVSATPAPSVLVLASEPSDQPSARRFAAQLRATGTSANVDIDGRNLKAQMKLADRMGARYALIVDGSRLILRDMLSGEQRETSIESAIQTMGAQ